MKYLAYIRQNNGWQKIELKNSEEVRYFIKDIYKLDERSEVIIKYKKDDTDFVLCHFVNTLHNSYNVEMKLERKLK